MSPPMSGAGSNLPFSPSPLQSDAPRPNKRIVFDASDDDEEEAESSVGAGRTPGRGRSLFGEDEDEEEEEQEESDDFRIRPQYEGAKGQKVSSASGETKFILSLFFVWFRVKGTCAS